MYGVKLYYIVSLHQTTTGLHLPLLLMSCIISFLYIKPQQTTKVALSLSSRIISFLYIKPQLNCLATSTSSGCIISFLYIKPQLCYIAPEWVKSCIISFLYIKPQLRSAFILQIWVVLYRFSTSNHNGSGYGEIQFELYYIVSLHQTTT